MKMNFFLDFKKNFVYKAAVLIVLSLLSFGIFAKDLYLAYLPAQATKTGDNKYQLMKDFDTSVKQVKALFVGDSSVKDELLTNEENYRVHVFYNLKPSAPWHKIYVIAWDDKVFARIFK